jgi:HKD family nuclease
MKVVLQPFGERALGEVLKSALSDEMENYSSFQAAVAFVKRSGVQHIQDELRAFIGRGGFVRMALGVDYQGTSFEGLSDLLTTVGGEGDVFINHDEGWYVSFHPKLYLFEGEDSASLIVGSGNLTEGGLYTNDEASLACMLDLSDADDQAVLREVKAVLDTWCNEESETVSRLDHSFLQSLVDGGYIKPEARAREGDAEAKAADKVTRRASDQPPTKRKPLFGRGAGRYRPPRRRPSTEREPVVEEVASAGDGPRGFVMTLMRTDVGVGQTTPGTSRRSPEIFIPLTARNRHPEFWGWQSRFTEDPSKPGKFDRWNVPVRIGGEVVSVNMMTWPDKHDFRLRSEKLRSAGQEGDIIRIERVNEGLGFVYYVEIIPRGTSEYEAYLATCANPTPNSERKWGYYD